MGKLLTVKDVQKIIPMGRTSVTAIIKTLPHINTGGKLLVDEEQIDRWIRIRTVYPDPPRQEAARHKPRNVEPIASGPIPYRHTRRNTA